MYDHTRRLMLALQVRFIVDLALVVCSTDRLRGARLGPLVSGASAGLNPRDPRKVRGKPGSLRSPAGRTPSLASTAVRSELRRYRSRPRPSLGKRPPVERSTPRSIRWSTRSSACAFERWANAP
jgi:hypothetical protein